jgi:hypothetical protein
VRVFRLAIFVAIASAACSRRPLELPMVDGGSCGAPSDAYVDCCIIGDGESCDAQPLCHAIYSGDFPCNNASCDNHFVACTFGFASCSVFAMACTQPTPTCRTGYTLELDGNVCPRGCVAIDKCETD